MAQQAESDLNNNPFILSGVSYVRNGVTLAQDAGRAAVLAVRTLMAKVAVTIPTTMTADVGNTGDGTVTAVAHGAGASPIVGTYVLLNTAAVTNGGVWQLTDPNGVIVETGITQEVGAGATTVVVAGGMVFTITDGATDFAAADEFTIAITANGQWVPWAVDGVNGSEIPAGILMVDSVTAAALVAGTVTDQTILVGGCMTVASDQIIFDDGASTLATVLPGGQTIAEFLETKGIFTELTVDIASYET
jgi:hypothetical protein